LTETSTALTPEVSLVKAPGPAVSAEVPQMSPVTVPQPAVKVEVL